MRWPAATDCLIVRNNPRHLSRRRFLKSTAAGFSTIALSEIAWAQLEAAPMLGPDGKPILTRGWFASESIALDGPFVYIRLERADHGLGR
jgi:hypothetical protein